MTRRRTQEPPILQQMASFVGNFYMVVYKFFELRHMAYFKLRDETFYLLGDGIFHLVKRWCFNIKRWHFYYQGMAFYIKRGHFLY